MLSGDGRERRGATNVHISLPQAVEQLADVCNITHDCERETIARYAEPRSGSRRYDLVTVALSLVDHTGREKALAKTDELEASREPTINEYGFSCYANARGDVLGGRSLHVS